MEVNEEKRKKFMEYAGKRVNNVMHDIQILEPMSRSSAYDFTKEDVEEMFFAMQEALNTVKASYDKKFEEKSRTERKVFSFGTVTPTSNTNDNEENIEEQEPPIDNYVEKLSKINCKGVAKEKGGFAINGVKLGMTKEEVEKLIGSPEKFNDDEYDSSLVSAVYGSDESNSPVIQYNKENGKYTVYSVTVNSKSEEFKTDRGLKVGDTFEKLISKYAKDEKVKPYEKSPNVYVLYGAEDIDMNEDEGVMYPKSKESQYATMYGFYDSGLEDVGLIVSYNYGDNCIDYLVKNGVIETITLMPMRY